MIGVGYCFKKTMHSPNPLLLHVAERTLGPDFAKGKKSKIFFDHLHSIRDWFLGHDTQWKRTKKNKAHFFKNSSYNYTTLSKISN
jgi:hypothetical protein